MFVHIILRNHHLSDNHLSSVHDFNLDLSRKLLCGKELIIQRETSTIKAGCPHVSNIFFSVISVFSMYMYTKKKNVAEPKLFTFNFPFSVEDRT